MHNLANTILYLDYYKLFTYNISKLFRFNILLTMNTAFKYYYIFIYTFYYYFTYVFYFRPQINKGSEDLPIEYLTSSLAQQNQVRSIYYLRIVLIRLQSGGLKSLGL